MTMVVRSTTTGLRSRMVATCLRLTAMCFGFEDGR
jgi:hypothetical protein